MRRGRNGSRGEQGGGGGGGRGVAYLNSDLFRVEVAMAPVVCVVDALELGEGAGRADGDVIGVEVGVDDESAVEHQTCVVAGCQHKKTR